MLPQCTHAFTLGGRLGSVACFGMIRTTVVAMEATAGEAKPLLYEPRDYALNSLAEGGGDEEEAGASWIERMPQPWRRLTSVHRTHARPTLFCILPRLLRRFCTNALRIESLCHCPCSALHDFCVCFSSLLLLLLARALSFVAFSD